MLDGWFIPWLGMTIFSLIQAISLRNLDKRNHILQAELITERALRRKLEKSHGYQEDTRAETTTD